MTAGTSSRAAEHRLEGEEGAQSTRQVFPIAYGADADWDTLKAIAEASDSAGLRRFQSVDDRPGARRRHLQLLIAARPFARAHMSPQAVERPPDHGVDQPRITHAGEISTSPGDPAADGLLNTDPLALLIGMLLDQQVPMEWAFGAHRSSRSASADPSTPAASPPCHWETRGRVQGPARPCTASRVDGQADPAGLPAPRRAPRRSRRGPVGRRPDAKDLFKRLKACCQATAWRRRRSSWRSGQAVRHPPDGWEEVPPRSPTPSAARSPTSTPPHAARGARLQEGEGQGQARAGRVTRRTRARRAPSESGSSAPAPPRR